MGPNRIFFFNETIFFMELFFYNRTNKDTSLFITFNTSNVETVSSQNHLGLILDERLDFKEHL